jgi:hypothetical protein
MARARNIKPGFFTNDILAECEPLARILFQGLWCHADREGRLEDRPRKLKAEILPYDECDIENLLSQLTRHGFIVRYQHGDGRFIQVVNFVKHQNPHVKESESTIPAPCLSGAKPEQAGLIPDSPLLIPDSPIPMGGEQVANQPSEEQPAPADEQRKTSGTPKRGCQLPADFYPDATGVELAESTGVNIAIELPKFSDHHRAKGSVMKDWQAAWRTWARNAVKFAASRTPPPTYRKTVGEDRAETLAALTGRNKTHERTAPDARDIPGTAIRVA